MTNLSSTPINVLGQKVSMWKWLLIGVVILLTFLLIILGKLVYLGVLVGGVWFVVLSYYKPMPAIFVMMMLSTNLFQFIDVSQYLPYFLIAPGLRINILDSLLIMLFGMSLIKLYLRKEQSLFLKPMILVAGVTVIPFITQLLLGLTNLDIGMNFFRVMFTYTFYFILVANIDSPARFRTLIIAIFVILIVSVGIQILEASLGRRLTLGLSLNKFYNTGQYVMIADQKILYLWSRVGLYLYVGLFLSLGASLSGQQIRKHLPIALMGILGFIISLVRVWFICIPVGVLVVMVFQKRHRFRTIAIAIFIMIGLLGAISVVDSLTQSTYGGSLLDVLIERLKMINPETSTVVSRIDIWKAQLEYFKQSPIFGYGLNQQFKNMQSADTGVINTLLQFGIVGTLAYIVLIVTVLMKGYQLWKRLQPSLERGYVTGVLGLWVGMLVGYFFSWNFFTIQDGIWGVTLAMAILDRIWYLYAEKETTINEEMIYQ